MIEDLEAILHIEVDGEPYNFGTTDRAHGNVSLAKESYPVEVEVDGHTVTVELTAIMEDPKGESI